MNGQAGKAALFKAPKEDKQGSKGSLKEDKRGPGVPRGGQKGSRGPPRKNRGPSRRTKGGPGVQGGQKGSRGPPRKTNRGPRVQGGQTGVQTYSSLRTASEKKAAEGGRKGTQIGLARTVYIHRM